MVAQYNNAVVNCILFSLFKVQQLVILMVRLNQMM